MNIKNHRSVEGVVRKVHKWGDTALLLVEEPNKQLHSIVLAGESVSEDLLNDLENTKENLSFVIVDTDEVANLVLIITNKEGDKIYEYSTHDNDSSNEGNSSQEEVRNMNNNSPEYNNKNYRRNRGRDVGGNSGSYGNNRAYNKTSTFPGGGSAMDEVTQNLEDSYQKGRSVMVMLWMNIKRTLGNRQHNEQFAREVIEAAKKIERFLYPSNNGGYRGRNRKNS